MLELIIVMVIVAIGAVLTTPNISGWLPNYRLRSATKDVASIMRLAQIKAVMDQSFDLTLPGTETRPRHLDHAARQRRSRLEPS
jgi:Tfp pilus assembly protein FimT